MISGLFLSICGLSYFRDKGFCPWSLGPIALGPVAEDQMEGGHGGGRTGSSSSLNPSLTSMCSV